ncbi:MAG TPA: hypothetical protein VJG67_01915 [Candidatus Paceibacterota bacterium]|uniref:Uncharacterized protein n=1 Tax=Candidatus Woykebacteria bacterium RBG_19FT_COMBO_43_10 TaxID=1802598 RepID=A0A1G1WLF8_9BACT|nr:MAG: hypothetical protein A2Z42_02085 [Candidatus Woykebacteria bacterium RBG_19FT_COMBO_43_10]
MVLEVRGVQNDETRWAAFVESAFKAANLPDVPKDELETGTYTNRQIADNFRQRPIEFMSLLMDLPDGSDASRRSILSFAVDLIEDEK